ncbi:acyl-CoA dehydrogenase C-terminal domain-containing protein [Nocardia sp. NPDC059180]|uniref:acyl-CoA dehydrogenase C-terminal domain-containing protein n=1 Tax=Nocardia sp. NPDC059180 TaxID=3346761 RepID=UPI0036847B1E
MASAALPSAGSDRDFYAGKIAVASFFLRTVLPRLGADRAVIADIDPAIMDLCEAAF